MKTPATEALALSAFLCLQIVSISSAFGQTSPPLKKPPSSDSTASSTVAREDAFGVVFKFGGSRIDVDYDATKADAKFLASATLDTLCSNAEIVIVAEVSSAVVRSKLELGTGTPADFGDILDVKFIVRVGEVLTGVAPKESQLLVNLWRVGDNLKDDLPFLKAGEKCILFLKRSGSTSDGTAIWSAPDRFFGVEPYSAAKANLLKRRTKGK